MTNAPKYGTPAHKRACLEALLENGMVMVQLDASRDGVDVPPHLAGNATLRLNLSLAFQLDTFEIDDDGVRANLSFQGVRHLCVMPWAAVYAVLQHGTERMIVFPDDVPEEAAEEWEAAMAARKREAELGEAEAPRPVARPKLRLVK